MQSFQKKEMSNGNVECLSILDRTRRGLMEKLILFPNQELSPEPGTID
jgi:hypothetical protein